jgi:predicted alpha/beta superfamily hydrolase
MSEMLLLVFMIQFALLAPDNQASGAPGQSSEASVAGDLRIHPFTSRVFGNTRKLRVLLPPGYDVEANKTRRYPVLYLNDGQNLFDASTSIFNPLEWQADETVARLLGEDKIEPLIVVGIDNAGKRLRPREYLPYVDSSLQPPEPDPQGKKYPGFLIEEVMPFINATYRTKVGPENTGLGGSSYGGAVALYTAITRPGVIGRLLLESPSIYISDNQLIRDGQACNSWPDKVYLAIGTNEAGREDWNAEAIGLIRELEKVLKEAGLGQDRLNVLIDEGATHHEGAWANRLPGALVFLFSN